MRSEGSTGRSTVDHQSEARKVTAFAESSGSPHRPNGIVDEMKSDSLSRSPAVAEARTPRFHIGVLVAPGATTFARIRGAQGPPRRVVAALCARALGPERVIALFMPETESSDDSVRLSAALTERLGIRSFTEDIGQLLEASGCYRRRDEAIRSVVPEYGEGYKSKIVLPNFADGDRYALFSLVVESPSG